jgi:hypothetical protein
MSLITILRIAAKQLHFTSVCSHVRQELFHISSISSYNDWKKSAMGYLDAVFLPCYSKFHAVIKLLLLNFGNWVLNTSQQLDSMAKGAIKNLFWFSRLLNSNGKVPLCFAFKFFTNRQGRSYITAPLYFLPSAVIALIWWMYLVLVLNHSCLCGKHRQTLPTKHFKNLFHWACQGGSSDGWCVTENSPCRTQNIIIQHDLNFTWTGLGRVGWMKFDVRFG